MEADRVQQFRECIECFLCVNTCHVLRDHAQFEDFAGPRNLVRLAQYEMHPLDLEDRVPEIKKEFGVEYCNITRCCTEVCPAGIQITDDAIIQLKERVVDRYYDPLQRIWRTITRKKVRYWSQFRSTWDSIIKFRVLSRQEGDKMCKFSLGNKLPNVNKISKIS